MYLLQSIRKSFYFVEKCFAQKRSKQKPKRLYVETFVHGNVRAWKRLYMETFAATYMALIPSASVTFRFIRSSTDLLVRMSYTEIEPRDPPL